MKPVNKTKWTTLLILGMVLSFFASCEKDKNEGGNVNELIVGTWTLSTYSFDPTINGQSIAEYVMAALGMTKTEAELYAAQFEPEELSSGTITINSDGTYSSNIDNDPFNGTYKINAEGKTITFDEGTEEEMIMTIITLTSSTLIVENTDTMNIDLNQDGVSDIYSIIMRITYTK